MKLRQLAIMSLAFAFTHNAIAQNHDDIYYDSSKDEEKDVVEDVKDEAVIVDVNPDEMNQDAMFDYFSADQTANWHGNHHDRGSCRKRCRRIQPPIHGACGRFFASKPCRRHNQHRHDDGKWRHVPIHRAHPPIP